VNVYVEITFHTFLTSALAGSKDEVTLVINTRTETIRPHCSTEESFQGVLTWVVIPCTVEQFIHHSIPKDSKYNFLPLCFSWIP